MFISLKNITKKYKETKALDNLSLELPKAKCIGIVGASGSGKSTLVQILGGLDIPTSGEVIIDGKNITKFRDNQISKFRNDEIGFVFQSMNLLEFLNLTDNVALPAIINGQESKLAKEKAIKLLKELGLESEINKLPNQVSGGQLQRASIARSLINDPNIIIADEPTGNLDKENAVNVLEILKNLTKDGITVIVVTHDNRVEHYFDEVIKLEYGKLAK